jgi:NAD(P)-dependent dehydrogenase (short-subunit alcohol dehydrogenase family)
MAKAAISQLTRHMALEWAEYGIRANAIAPGFMDTPLAAPIWADPDVSRWILNRVPLERAGHPAELVGACLLLASDAGSFLTGQTLFVDGGAQAGGRWFHPDR